jgi:hypothetical protein
MLLCVHPICLIPSSQSGVLFVLKIILLRSRQEAPIDYPVKGLDLRPYLCNPEQQKEPLLYDLYGVTVCIWCRLAYRLLSR